MYPSQLELNTEGKEIIQAGRGSNEWPVRALWKTTVEFSRERCHKQVITQRRRGACEYIKGGA